MIVTEKQLVARINRRLIDNGQQVHRCRPGRLHHELGDYYLRDVDMNAILDKRLDIEDLGRELGVLRACDRLQEAA